MNNFKKRMIVLATAFALSFVAIAYGLATAPTMALESPVKVSNAKDNLAKDNLAKDNLAKDNLAKDNLGFGRI